MKRKLLGFLWCRLGELGVLLKCFLDGENSQEADKVQDINGKMRTREGCQRKGKGGRLYQPE